MNMIITADNRIKKNVHPLNGKEFSLAELQTIVKGYIEIVELGNGYILVCNEEAKLLGQKINMTATTLAYTSKAIAPFDCINGDVLLCKSELVK